jgi:hypothetical protein
VARQNLFWSKLTGPYWAKVNEQVRSLFSPGRPVDLNLSSSATINAQIWFNQFPLRPTAGWSVVAALFAYGLLARPLVLDWRAVALLLLLADPLWGSIWRLAAGRTELLPLQAGDVGGQMWLPYLQPGSPAARLLGWDDHGMLHLLFRVGVPTVLLALAIALVLGYTAVWMTLLVIAISVLGWIGRHTVQNPPALLHSVVTVVLPWMLTLSLLGLSRGADGWSAHGWLIGLWFLHNWGEGRVLRRPEDWLGVILLAVADLGIAVLLIVMRAPWWLALLSVLWLATWLTVYQRRSLHHLHFWWLLAMLISGLALGQSI